MLVSLTSLLALVALSAHAAEWRPFQTLKTMPSNDVEFFSIPYGSFLAYAEDWSVSIFKFNNVSSSFEPFQTILQDFCLGVTFFKINGEAYLVAASFINDLGMIFRWDAVEGSFKQYQKLSVRNPRKFTFTTIGSSSILGAVDSTGSMTIFEWDGSQFQNIQEIMVESPQELTFYTFGSHSFAAVAAAGDYASVVYKWNAIRHAFEEFQFLPTTQSTSIAFYSTNGVAFIAVASLSDAVWIFSWVPATQSFALNQTIQTTSISYSVTPYTIDGQQYLGLAATGSPPQLKGTSLIFEYVADFGKLEPIQDLHVDFAKKLTFANTEGVNWLAVAQIDANPDNLIDSQLFLYM